MAALIVGVRAASPWLTRRPRGPNDPLWPLDARFGASEDAVEIGPEAVRGVPATRCRLTADLARADAELPRGVSVPSGPYRSLSRLPAEVWLDSDGLVRRISVSSEPAAAADAQVWSVASGQAQPRAGKRRSRPQAPALAILDPTVAVTTAGARQPFRPTWLTRSCG